MLVNVSSVIDGGVFMVFLLQVNDAVVVGDHTLVSCSSDTTLKVGNSGQLS